MAVTASGWSQHDLGAYLVDTYGTGNLEELEGAQQRQLLALLQQQGG